MPMKINEDNIKEIMNFLVYLINNYECPQPVPEWWRNFCHETESVPCKSMGDLLKDQVILYMHSMIDYTEAVDELDGDDFGSDENFSTKSLL